MNYHRRASILKTLVLRLTFVLDLLKGCLKDYVAFQVLFYLQKMDTRRLLMVRWLWRLNPLVGPDGGSSKKRMRCVKEIVQLVANLSVTYLRPHIKLYHTIVPCRWCWDEEMGCCCCWGSGLFIWMEVWSFWLRPIEDPLIEDPLMAGFIPLPIPIHGRPIIGVGSSGGVT